MKLRSFVWAGAVICMAGCFVASLDARESGPTIRMTPRLLEVPTVSEASGFTEPGVKGIFYSGPNYHGKPTRVFAWVGVPATLKSGEKAPGMVLVHGGGGTAFANWARMWTAKGYVAIAMDTCGQLPRRVGRRQWERDPRGGPPGWGGFNQVDQPVEDQWPYQAACDVILADSLLRSMPQVDAARIGLTGISWGGYLTCIVAGVDHRFQFAAPIYGCGFLGEDSAWLGNFKAMGAKAADQWLARFDPSIYLKDATMPMLWVDGTNDLNYPLESLAKSYRLPKGPRTLCIRVRMPHGHPQGEAAPETYAFADAIPQGGKPLTKVTDQGRQDQHVWATFQSPACLKEAVLNYTCDQGPWPKRLWQTIKASIGADRAQADLPAGTTTYYFNFFDAHGLCVSSGVREVR